VSTALRFLGQHLSNSAAQLLVAPAGSALRGGRLKDLHPLVARADELTATPLLPGVLDKDCPPQVLLGWTPPPRARVGWPTAVRALALKCI
jgi:hypothetical protein